MSNKLSIGIAGYMGSGKSTCARLLAEKYGYKVIDADLEAKNLMRESKSITNRLIEEFGDRIIENDILSFKKLGKIVFSNINELKKLNTIVHPPLIEALKRKFFGEDLNEKVVLDASLIPLWHIEEWFSLRLWIKADLETRVKRILAKGSELTESEIRKRAKIQMNLFGEPSEDMWIYIKNEESIQDLEKKIDLIFK
ncbi:MAG: dephospho-CoA kinase [Chitinispirillaceae bacterium]|nr:dephospho-CoA kinase [Chitinispirillaceae bacterium]